MTFRKGPPATQLPIDSGETAPKRGPGRPRKDGSAPSRPAARRDLKAEISGLLMTVNIVMAFVPPLSGDALDVVEIEALAQALADEAKRSARFARMLDSALQVTGGAGLFGVVAIIATRRAARHEAFGLTRDMDAMLGALLAQSVDYKPSGAPPAIQNANANGASGPA